MNTALRATTLPIVAALCLAGAAIAQKDRVVLTDGTVVDGVQVTAFDLRKVEFRRRGTTENRSTDLVESVDVQRIKDVYRRAYASAGTTEGPGNFLQQAEKESDPFVKQFGYYEAAMLFVKNGQYADAFQVLETLSTKCPDSGYVPLVYQVKLDYYLGQGKAKAGDAATVAKRYSTAAQTQGFPPGFVVEAKYYETMAQAVAGGMTGDRLRSTLRAIQSEAASFPNTAARCRVQIANTLRAENKLAEARAEYEDLVNRGNAPGSVRAQAWLGLGQCLFSEGSASNKDVYRDALLAFLRVYIDSPDANPDTIAEALHMGSQAAEKWGGDDAARMARVLRGRLLRDYPDSQFAKR